MARKLLKTPSLITKTHPEFRHTADPDPTGKIFLPMEKCPSARIAAYSARYLQFPAFELSLSAATFATLCPIIVKTRVDGDDDIGGVL